MANVLIVGATSVIAQAVARRYAARGDTLYLLARNLTSLRAVADDLLVRGAATVHATEFLAEDKQNHCHLVETVWQELGHVDIALIAHGTLPIQSTCDINPPAAIAALEVNAISVVSIVSWMANRFHAQRSGVLGIVSSVAGDRGRKSNYVYGAAKALVNAYASGLRHRLYERNVRVTLIKPGFIDTPMTASFSKGRLWTSADRAGELIVRALDRGVSVAYIPGFWRWIMLIIRGLPESVFVRTQL